MKLSLYGIMDLRARNTYECGGRFFLVVGLKYSPCRSIPLDWLVCNIVLSYGYIVGRIQESIHGPLI